jgi:DNA-binding response OmpR family regulator
MAGEKILIVDDEPEIVELIQMYLIKEGYQVQSTHNGPSVFEYMEQFSPDLVILDILLPGMDGIEICRQLRRTINIPILFISCKKEDADIILGLNIGGDDYMTKPFSPSQLVARVQAHLRRKQLLDNVWAGGKLAPISSKEFDLLALMAKKANTVIPIEHLYQKTWGVDSNGDTRTLLVHISNLRKKIEPNPAEPTYVQTVRGVGYKFNSHT